MTCLAQNHNRENQANAYATRADFCKVFAQDQARLYQLSLLLTRDHEKAERCFVTGLEDCAKANRVFKEWAFSWAKRVIVENAIRDLKPRPGNFDSSSSAVVPNGGRFVSGPEGHFEKLNAVLALQDFERFVFVMSVLEHHSEHDCALLLACPVSDIREARARALASLVDSGQPVF